MRSLLDFVRSAPASEVYPAVSSIGDHDDKLTIHAPSSSHGSRHTFAETPPRRNAPIIVRLKASAILLTATMVLLSVWADRSLGRRKVRLCAATPDVGNDGTKDIGMNRLLSEAQCNVVFPDLYKELDRSVAHYQAKGLITSVDLDEATQQGHARVMIHDNRVFVKAFGGGIYRRAEAVLNAIQEAVITSPEPLPNVEFVIKTKDRSAADDEGLPLWVLDRTEQQQDLWLMPDYGFYSWPEPGVGGIAEVRDKCGEWEARQRWKDKIPKLFWRGAILNKLRADLLEIVEGYEWNDVAAIVWQRLDGMLKTPEEHCAYKYLAHAEGVAYSGRLKYIQMCRSVIVAHELQFIQHFHHLLDPTPGSPTQNMVLVSGPDFWGLPQVMRELLDDDDRAEAIANNSYDLFRHYLSPAAVTCYWRQAFRSWAKVQGFEPIRLPSDTSFESFNLMHEVHWQPH